MAVWDYNGSTSTAIATIYDNNGSTSTQIASVYDNNGSTSTQVYSRRLYLWNNGNVGYTATAGGTSGTTYGQFYATSANTNGNWAWAYVTADVTNYTSLVIYLTRTKGTYSYVRLGISGNWTAMEPSVTVGQSWVDLSSFGATTASHTFDISSLTGSRNIGFHVYSGSTVSATASVVATSGYIYLS